MAVLVLTGCVPTIRNAVPTIRNAVIDVRAPITESESERAFKAITQALLDKGFDITIKDTELRIITTEYKKFESVSGPPPLDFYLQVKAVVRDVPGHGGEISLWPKVKEQNRLDHNTSTEHPLIQYSSEELANTFDMTDRSQAMQKGHVLFQSLVQAIADTLGAAPGSFKQTMDKIAVVGM